MSEFVKWAILEKVNVQQEDKIQSVELAWPELLAEDGHEGGRGHQHSHAQRPMGHQEADWGDLEPQQAI